jgi:hypothetical protein
MLNFVRFLGAGAAPPGVPVHPGVHEEAGEGGEGGSRSTDLIESGSNPDPDPKPCLFPTLI